MFVICVARRATSAFHASSQKNQLALEKLKAQTDSTCACALLCVLSDCTNYLKLESSVFLQWMWTTLWPNRSLTISTAAVNPSWMGMTLLYLFVVVIKQTQRSCFFLHSLKRTTDIMFGGKQVVVCGYGEVSDLKSKEIEFPLVVIRVQLLFCLFRLVKAAALHWKLLGPLCASQRLIQYVPCRHGKNVWDSLDEQDIYSQFNLWNVSS